jgi:hypothetical protein
MMLGKLLLHRSSATTNTGRRFFSRADIIKGLDKSKVSRRVFAKKELTENPEFFKAFPHMQGIMNAKDDTVGKSRTLNQSGDDVLEEFPTYKKDVVLGFKDPSGKNDEGYFEGLLNQHNNYMTPKEKEEAIRENERNFIEAYGTPEGPMKWLSKEELECTHALIDVKMQELEDSGLTREEILYDKQQGIPLADDPFFQFVKNSRTAREMLMKPGEEFSVERVLEKALR